MAPSIATQHQNTRRELAYTVGVDGYLQGQCSGSAAYLITQAYHLQPLLENPKAQDLSYDTGSLLLGNSKAQGLQVNT